MLFSFRRHRSTQSEDILRQREHVAYVLLGQQIVNQTDMYKFWLTDLLT